MTIRISSQQGHKMNVSLKCSLAQVLIVSILSIACETHSIPKKVPTKPNTESGAGTPEGGSSGGGETTSITWQVTDVEGIWTSECYFDDYENNYKKIVYNFELTASDKLNYNWGECAYTDLINCEGNIGGSRSPLTLTLSIYPNELKSQIPEINQEGSYFFMDANDIFTPSIFLWGSPNSKEDMVYYWEPPKRLDISDPDFLSNLVDTYSSFFDQDLTLVEESTPPFTYKLKKIPNLSAIGCSEI